MSKNNYNARKLRFEALPTLRPLQNFQIEIIRYQF